MRAKCSKKGFTLLEILVVMLIIALIMGIALPRFGALLGSRIKSDMRSLVGAVEFAFFLANSQKKPVRINYDVQSGKYWLSMLQIVDEEKNVGEFVDFTDKKKQLSSGVKFVDIFIAHSGKVDTGIVFTLCTPQGYCEPTTIHLRDDSEHDFTLRLKPLTGEVTIYQGYRDFVEFNPSSASW